MQKRVFFERAVIDEQSGALEVHLKATEADELASRFRRSGIEVAVEPDVWSSRPPSGGNPQSFSIIRIDKDLVPREAVDAIVSEWNQRSARS